MKHSQYYVDYFLYDHMNDTGRELSYIAASGIIDGITIDVGVEFPPDKEGDHITRDRLKRISDRDPLYHKFKLDLKAVFDKYERLFINEILDES